MTFLLLNINQICTSASDFDQANIDLGHIFIVKRNSKQKDSFYNRTFKTSYGSLIIPTLIKKKIDKFSLRAPRTSI